MDIPSLSEGPVGSRFVSQDEIDLAKQRKEEQWKAAYARLGQEPPPQQQQEDTYDGRSLAEVGTASRIPFSYSRPLLVFHISRNLLQTGFVLATLIVFVLLTPGTDSKAGGMGREEQTRSFPLILASLDSDSPLIQQTSFVL
jgi:hypothetical protein